MMDTMQECVCYHEIPVMISLNEETMVVEKLKQPLNCITENPGFSAVCLNPWVIQTAWYQYK